MQNGFRLTPGYNPSYTQAVKTAISIADEVFDEAERLSKRLGMSRSELYTKAVAVFVRAQRGKGVKQALDAVYGSESSKLDPMLEKLQAASLPREEW
jgi:metal-responsive CopG/Arc/MetJ family transcriptional regulator